MFRKMALFLIILLLISCNDKSQTDDSMQNGESNEIEGSKHSEEILAPEETKTLSITQIGSIEEVSGVWEIDDSFNQEMLTINENKTFNLRLNHCTGYSISKGIIYIEKGLLIFKNETNYDLDGNILVREVSSLELILKSDSNLHINNELEIISNGDKLGVCSPREGEILYKIR